MGRTVDIESLLGTSMYIPSTIRSRDERHDMQAKDRKHGCIWPIHRARQKGLVKKSRQLLFLTRQTKERVKFCLSNIVCEKDKKKNGADTDGRQNKIMHINVFRKTEQTEFLAETNPSHDELTRRPTFS